MLWSIKCYFVLVRRNSYCCEAQNLPFWSWMSTSSSNTPHLQMTENHKPLVIFRTAPHTHFSSMLSHCSTVSQWLPCWVFYISCDKLSRHTFIISLSDISVCSVKCRKISKKQLLLALWQTVELYNICYHFILVCLPLDSVAELTCWLRWCALQCLIKHWFILPYHGSLLWKLKMSALFKSNGCLDWQLC